MRKTLILLPFLLLTTSCKSKYVESGFYQGTDLPSPWFSSALKTERIQNTQVRINAYLGYRYGHGSEIKEMVDKAEAKCYAKRVFAPESGEYQYNILRGIELVDIGNEDKYAYTVIDVGEKYSVKLDYSFGFEDVIDVKDFPFDKGCVLYVFGYADENGIEKDPFANFMGTDSGGLYFKITGDSIEFSDDYHLLEE